MNTKQRTIMAFLLAFSFFISGCEPGLLLEPTLTPTSTPAPTPTLPPHSFVIIKSALSGDILGITIQDTDSDGEALDTLGLGIGCLGGGIYVVDETGSRLECVHVTDGTDAPNQIAMIFAGASAGHTYQLVRGEDPPIDLFPEHIAE